MQHQATNCPEHGRAVSCTGPDDADVLFGTCDWGNHSVTTISEKYIADHRAGNVREIDFEGAREKRDASTGPVVTTQAAVAADVDPIAFEAAKLTLVEREQLLSALRARNEDAAITTGVVSDEPPVGETTTTEGDAPEPVETVEETV